ncbi:MAG: MATE family efflux transporter [Natronomonas sp.]
MTRRRMHNGVHRVISGAARLFGATGLVDSWRAERTLQLASPIFVTSALRTLLRTTDFFLISIALGDAAIAALEFGYQYYFLTLTVGMVVANGSISVVSRYVGSGNQRDADFTVKQALWIVLVFSAPISYGCWRYADWLMALLTDDAKAIALGATYLRIAMLALPFRSWSLVALRSLQGAGDTLTPMLVRAISLPTNIVLSAVLIFGIGSFPELGIAGAAWGLVIAQTLASTIFLGVALSGRFAIQLCPFERRWWDWTIVAELLKVGAPLGGRRLVRYGVRFPFLWVLATLGTPVVAAYAISQRIIRFARLPSNGIGTATASLVGQELGAGEEQEAEVYGTQITWISIVLQGGTAVVIMAFAPVLVGLFGLGNLRLGVVFVWVFGIGVFAQSVERVMRGSLQAAGDTTFPFYGTVIGKGFRLGFALLALPAGYVVASLAGRSFAPGIGIGIAAVFLGVLADYYSQAIVCVYRYLSGTWKTVARRSAVGAAGEGND